ncbi:class I SAM-dependent methyltransferase [Myroides pelagicus]|uniref:Methyltransferase domain-containing protein n=1 Tax=Myroides pelagicus TaxID=270914 RepID=A0A7K1GNY5_9FLAO|nr:class I SAM-dependent methyltransferase [Myroides pelagicus]MEC4114792.1 class I SAM-dependent methyltransferase [Myroides pelagicus]MTH30597.1 methyltransferase domain-containing protein [Myroides pelagicus]
MKQSKTTNRYDSLASWIYHLDKPIGRSFGDIEFYYKLLKGCTGPILEPAVGNGRVLIPLLEKGLEISGFDASKKMMEYCTLECKQRGLTPRLSIERFENFATDHSYQAIILPAGSFQLITDFSTAIQVLKRFKSVLGPQGRLILDLSTLACLSEPTMLSRSWEVPGGLITLTEQRQEVNYIKQTTTSQLRYEYWLEGKLTQSELDLFALRFWGVEEFSLALKEAGFTTIKTYANYSKESTIDQDTHTLTFEAF